MVKVLHHYYRSNDLYRNIYQDLPMVIELTIPKMEYLLRRTIKSMLVWREHWKGELLREMEKCTCQTFCVSKETELIKMNTQSRFTCV